MGTLSMTRRGPGLLLWYSRIVLGLVMLLLLAIGAKFLFDTVPASAERGIAVSTGFGRTVARVGFGAFPVASAIIVGLCLLAAQRLRFGLTFVAVLFCTVLVVRLVGAVADHSLRENVPLIIPEVVFIILTIIGLLLWRSTDPSSTPHSPDGRQ